MSSQATIVVFDGAATPVTHSLLATSVTVDPKTSEITALYREGLSTVPVYAQIRATFTSRRLKSGVWRNAITVEVPVMETVSGQNAAGYTASPKVAYVNTVQVVTFNHERSTIAERRLARMLAVNIANNITTSVAAATTGPASELLDSFIAPS